MASGGVDNKVTRALFEDHFVARCLATLRLTRYDSWTRNVSAHFQHVAYDLWVVRERQGDGAPDIVVVTKVYHGMADLLRSR
jgi:hypothetical protein